MSRILQVFYFLCYGLAAAAVAFMAPKIFPETPRSVALLAGGVVFIAGALIHEIASRSYQASLDRHRLAVLHRAYTEAMEDLDRLAVDVRALKRTLAERPEPVAAGMTGQGEDRAASPPPVSPPPMAEEEFTLPTATERDGNGFRERPMAAPDTDSVVSDMELNPASPEGRVLVPLLKRLYAGTDANGNDPFAPDGSHTTVVSGSLIERETLNSVRNALKDNQLDLYLEPVVTLPQRREKHVDCDVRIAVGSGDFMPPALYNEILRANGLLELVDDMFLFRTLEHLAGSPPREAGSYAFCRILPGSLSDTEFFDTFLDYLKGADDLVSSIVFEFRESDLINLDEAGAAALGALVDLGFNLCVSQLQNFDVEADQLVEGGVRFVKVDAEMLMPAINDDAETARIRRLKRGLDDAGIDLIVSGIANEQLLVELLDFDVEFGQGPLFGDPRKAAPQATATVEGRRGRA